MTSRSTARSSIRPLIGVRDTLGHQLIDADNVAISNCWLRATDCEPIELPFQAARLRKLVRVQFDHEAALIEAIAGELSEPHRREHRSLMDLCDEAYALSAQSWKRARALLRRDFAKLFRNHLVCMDQIAVVIINTASQGGTDSRRQ